MNSDDEIYTADHFSKLFNKYDDSFKSLDWGSHESQNLRFEIITNIANLQGKRVLDVGCGLGDFYNWLIKNNINIEYTGIDITEQFINEANRKYPGSNFLHTSIMDETLLFEKQTFDYVFASGIFSTYERGGLDYMQACLARMWELCSKGMAFNSLSSWAKNKDENEFYADPILVINMVKKFSDKIIFRHDYHPRDFTLYVLRED